MRADLSNSDVLMLKGSTNAIARFVHTDPNIYAVMRGASRHSQEKCAEQIAKDLDRLSFAENVSVEQYAELYMALTAVGPGVSNDVLQLQKHYSQGDFDSDVIAGIIKTDYLENRFYNGCVNNDEVTDFQENHYHSMLVSFNDEAQHATNQRPSYSSLALFVLPNRKDFCIIRGDDCFSEHRTLTLLMNSDHPYLQGKHSLHLEGVEPQWISFSQAQAELLAGLSSSPLKSVARKLIRDDGGVDLFRLEMTMRCTFAAEYAGKPGAYSDLLHRIRKKTVLPGENCFKDWRSNLRHLKPEYQFVGKWWKDFSDYILSHEDLDPKQQHCFKIIALSLVSGLHALMQRNLSDCSRLAVQVVLEKIQENMQTQGLANVHAWLEPTVAATLCDALSDQVASKILELTLGVMVVNVTLAQLDVADADAAVLNTFINNLQQAHTVFLREPDIDSAEKTFNDTVQRAANVASPQLESKTAKKMLNSLVVLLLVLSVVGIAVLIYQYVHAKGPDLFSANSTSDILKQRLNDDLLNRKDRIEPYPIKIH